jgi:arylsulfatase A-like enzyme
MKPHTPFFPPQPWADMYPIEEMELPDPGPAESYPPHIQRRIEHHLRADPWLRKAHRAGYLGNLAFVDTCIGTVLDGLERLGLAENTIVVYTSDHGEMEGDHGLFQKFCLFEPSARVPLIVSWPGRLPQGVVTEALTEYMGLYPTLAELAGLPEPTSAPLVPSLETPSQLDARSFAEIVRHPDLPGSDAAFCEYALRSDVPQYMVRTRRWKYIHNCGSLDELYDLEQDPGEFHNCVQDPGLTSVRDELRERLFAWYDPEANPYH